MFSNVSTDDDCFYVGIKKENKKTKRVDIVPYQCCPSKKTKKDDSDLAILNDIKLGHSKSLHNHMAFVFDDDDDDDDKKKKKPAGAKGSKDDGKDKLKKSSSAEKVEKKKRAAVDEKPTGEVKTATKEDKKDKKGKDKKEKGKNTNDDDAFKLGDWW